MAQSPPLNTPLSAMMNDQRWSPRGRPWSQGHFEVLGLEASNPPDKAQPQISTWCRVETQAN